MQEKPNLHQVAKLAGVSIASASRALTGQSASAETVKKVRSAAKQLGYVPDATARSLRLGGTRQIVFAVDDIGNPNYVAMLRAIELEVAHRGIRLSVSATGREMKQTLDLVRSLNAGVADGLIISPIRVSPELRRALEECVVPVVVIGSLNKERVAIDRVRVDSTKAVEMAVDHLVETGRRHIAFINGPLDTNPGAARQLGFESAASRHGLTVSSGQMICADDFTAAAGLAAAKKLLENIRGAGEPIDAIVAANDLIGVGAVSACVGAGLQVPTDVAVTGIDDTEIAAVFNPPLTSVSLRAAKRGRQAAQLLLKRFEDPFRDPELLTVDPVLKVRASTVPPRPEGTE
ncbi:LacI family DNA-binding transcriptional regulator [Arthrobacter sp. M-10]|uniref:LacI family DNA-binding transcriptional regulator n=1 Tax=Arthrobacter sp. M-10 TaxID=3233037 RepID=UPI003F924989